MKKLTPATSPDAYVAALTGWRRERVQELREAVRDAAPLEEVIKWGHLVYLPHGPVLLIRAEDERVLLGFWRGQRLRQIEPRLRPGGKYEMATLELRATPPSNRPPCGILPPKPWRSTHGLAIRRVPPERHPMPARRLDDRPERRRRPRRGRIEFNLTTVGFSPAADITHSDTEARRHDLRASAPFQQRWLHASASD